MNRLILSCVLAFTSLSLAAEETRQYTPRQLAYAEDEIRAAMAGRWYDVEVILFERLRVFEFNTVESLLVDTPRSWPTNLVEYSDGTPSPLPELATFYEPELIRGCEGAGAPAELIPFIDPEVAGADLAIDELNLSQFDAEALPVGEPTQDSLDSAIGIEAENLDETEAQPTEASVAMSDEPLWLAPLEVSQQLPPSRQMLLAAAIASYEDQLAEASMQWRDDFAFETEVKYINRRSHLRPLQHLRWRQAVPARDLPQPILIEFSEPGAPAPRVQGHLDVTVGRYLHVNSRLWYAVPGLSLTPLASHETDTVQSPESAGRDYFEMHESRRMRSEELHYIDHPKLGLLVQVTPVPIPQALILHWLDVNAAAD